MDLSRRGFIGFLAAVSGGALPGGKFVAEAAAATSPAIPLSESPALTGPGAKLHEALRQHLGDEIYTSWLQRLEVEWFDGQTVTVSLPVKFLRNWVQRHWPDELLACSRAEFPSAQNVELVVRQPNLSSQEQLRREFEKMRRITDA